MSIFDGLIANALGGNGGGGGGGSSVLLVNIDEVETTWTLDATWQTIWNAMEAGTSVIVKYDNEAFPFIASVIYCDATPDPQYDVYITNGTTTNQFYTNSAEGYPYISFA